MAIKISGSTIVDDSRNIVDAGTVTVGGGLTVSGGGIDLNSSNTSFSDGVKVGRYITGQSGQKLTISNQSNGIYLEGGSGVIDLTSNITLGTGASSSLIIYPSTWTVYNNPTITLGGGNNNSANIVGGNVGIDSANPTAKLDVNGDVNISGIVTARTGVRISAGGLVVTAGVSTFSASSLFTANPKLNDSVILEIGTSADWELFHDGTNNYSDLNVGNLIIRDGTTTRFTFERTTGNFTATGNVTGYSDETLKDNIQTIPDALSKVTQLRGVEFDRNDIEGNPHQIGIIAQEVEKVIPEVVTTHDDGIKSVAYGNLVGVLIEAIKELKEEVNELKARLEEV